MGEQSPEAKNNLITLTNKISEAQKSAFAVDESSYKRNTVNIDALNAATSYPEAQAKNEQLQTELDSLKQQLRTVKDNYEQQKHEADTYKKQLEDAKHALEIANRKSCQCMTANDTQCTKTACKAIKYNGLSFWVCKQHLRQYPEAQMI